MKIFPKYLFLLWLAGNCAAQNFSQKIKGRWQTADHNLDSSLLFNSETVSRQFFNFSENGQFLREVYTFDAARNSTDTLIYSGFYKADNRQGTIAISEENKILKNTGRLKAVDKFKFSASFLSDTSVKLLNNIYYKKKPGPAVSYAIPEKGKKRFYIQNTLNEKKLVSITHEKIVMQVNETKAGGDHLSRLNNMECTLDSIVGDSVIVTLHSEEIDIEYRNRFTSVATNYYPGRFNKVSKTIALKDILYLNTKNITRETLTRVGSVIMSLSIMAIVASPLAGMSLHGDARASIRSEVFILGVSGFVASIPFFIAGRNKKYGFSPAYHARKNNYWQLKQLP